MMMKKSTVAALFLVVVAVLVAEAAAADCNPTQLQPCLQALIGLGDPSAECCNKLKEQQPCLCGYLQNPIFRPYIGSPNAKKIAAQCGVPVPTC